MRKMMWSRTASRTYVPLADLRRKKPKLRAEKVPVLARRFPVRCVQDFADALFPVRCKTQLGFDFELLLMESDSIEYIFKRCKELGGPDIDEQCLVFRTLFVLGKDESAKKPISDLGINRVNCEHCAVHLHWGEWLDRQPLIQVRPSDEYEDID